MGAKVLAVVKVYPASVEQEPESLAKAIEQSMPPEYKVVKTEIEDIGFGIRVLRLQILMPEATEGGTSQLEELIKGVDGVSEVEVEYVTRLP